MNMVDKQSLTVYWGFIEKGATFEGTEIDTGWVPLGTAGVFAAL